MRKFYIMVFLIMASLGLQQAANAEVSINIGINLPLPEIKISSPPAVVVIPGTYIYFAPDVDADIFFFRNHWYRLHNGRWHRSDEYNGSWAFITIDIVPRELLSVPSGYRHVPPGQERIPYGQLKKSWKKWEDERHWDGDIHSDHKGHKEHKEGKGKGRGKKD